MPDAQARALVQIIEQQQENLVTKDDLALQTAHNDAQFAKIESMFWRGVVIVSGVIVAVGGVIIGAIAAFS